jgi:adenylate cyclase
MTTLLTELKRRKVFRVAAVYGGTAFVVVQGADLVFPRLGLPDWTVTLVVALALAGLPLASVLAWAYEATPEGVRRTVPATSAELDVLAAQPRSRRWTTALLAVAGVLLLAGGAAWTVGGGRGAHVYDSLAVLPFVNMSGDAAYDYFGDGLAEELLNALSGIEGLKVAARTSAFAFRGGDVDVRTIGDTLRVAAVLEGSVRRSTDRIRISARLIDARSGYRLWAETYDQALTDLFAVQDAIAAEIVAALALQLTGAARTDGLYRGGTADVGAYDLYLLARQKWATREVPLLREAVADFEGAIARDSSFALAWSGFADAINALAWRRDAEALERVDEAKRAALEAILLEPELAEGWASLGVLALEFDRDWRAGELALRRAVRLKPSYSMAHNWLADALLYRGRFDESLAHRRRALEIDPIAPYQMANYAWALSVAGRWDEARAAFERLDHERDTNTETMYIAVANARQLGFSAEEAARFAMEWARRTGFSEPASAAVIGRGVLEADSRDAALATLGRLEDEGAPALELAGIFLALGDRGAALRLLERAFEQSDPQLILVAIEPTLDPLREDPRVVGMLRALGLPTEVSR